MSNALVNKNMAKLKIKILLEMINDIIPEYPNTNNFTQQRLIDTCDREGISTDEVTYFFSKSRSKNIFTNQACYVSKSAYAISRFKSIICFIKKRLSLCISKGKPSSCILKNLLLGLLMQTCFLHKFSLLTIFFIIEERF